MIEGTDKTHTWIVDPLDGTTNFLHAIPHFAINIALQREGADRGRRSPTIRPPTSCSGPRTGKGAFLNDRRLRVAARTRLDEAVFATGIPFMGHGQHASFLKELHQISQRVSGVRRFGSAALDLAWVAAGRFDGYWERDLSAWDLAAGILLVTEAGGMVTDADGGDDPLATGSICAGNLGSARPAAGASEGGGLRLDFRSRVWCRCANWKSHLGRGAAAPRDDKIAISQFFA